ncbi:TetR/AcrR family transcriptional regulator [Enterovibrio nigricans]|uniref:Transcriptional regulator, TetR family n=1 Tax=Enterovibrio nigricans DSM 22720 TaxID=1121868 RepID=A0A1T4V6K7_9GAMM|nr:TetR/AcrR family transcriptional regulator [Enterovibrio nigricans]SKA60554.1 transcriptional regulator, TetR family [Enterovibrio nigricans DSM 22720]
MATNLLQRKEQKRQQILEAASALFTKQGYGISMEAIADYANVSKQTVYAHFSNKDQLFETCIIEKCKNAGIDWDLEKNSRPADVVLKEYGWQFHNLILGEEAVNMFQNIVRQSDSHPEIAAIYLEQGPTRNVHLLSGYLNLLVERGDLPLCHDTRQSAMQLLLMLHGRSVYWAFFGFDANEDENTRRTYTDSCVDLFLRGHGFKY